MIVRDAAMSDRLRTLWDTPASLHTIAQELKCGTSTVVRAVHELMLAPRPSAIQPGSACAKRPERPAPKPVVGPTVRQFKAVPVPPRPPTARVVVEPPPRKCQWPTSDGRPWTLCDAPCSGTYCAEHQHWSRYGRPK